MNRRFCCVLATALLSAAVGCSSVGASAVRTGPLNLPPHVGAVELYAAGEQVAGADLGVVEVHAAQTEATIDTLLPVFVQKVAQIGGNAAVIENVRARFEIVSNPHVETYTYACGYNATCTGTRMYSMNDEVMVVSIRGHAVRTGALPGGPAAPPSPAAPTGSPPPVAPAQPPSGGTP
jgi:hypothetical protein